MGNLDPTIEKGMTMEADVNLKEAETTNATEISQKYQIKDAFFADFEIVDLPEFVLNQDDSKPKCSLVSIEGSDTGTQVVTDYLVKVLAERKDTHLIYVALEGGMTTDQIHAEILRQLTGDKDHIFPEPDKGTHPHLQFIHTVSDLIQKNSGREEVVVLSNLDLVSPNIAYNLANGLQSLYSASMLEPLKNLHMVLSSKGNINDHIKRGGKTPFNKAVRFFISDRLTSS